MIALQYVFFALPFVMAVLLALGIVFFGGSVLTRPVVPLIAYLTVYFIFAQSNYGSLDFRSNPVYARGTGQMFYPFLLWALLVALAWTWLGRVFERAPATGVPSVLKWLLAWLVLLLAHAAWGIVAGKDLADIFGGYGFAYVVWMAPLVLLMVWSARGQGTLVLVAQLLVLGSLAKSLFGLVRWGFFGGDSSNVYQNFGHIDVRLTYFDIVDSLVCLLGVAVAVSMLVVRRSDKPSRGWDALYVLTTVAGLLCITLSYRRTAWSGLALVGLFLLWRMRPGARLLAIVTGVPVVLGGLLFLAAQRLGTQTRSTGPLSFIFDLVSGRTGAESTRLLELRLAWESFADSPIVGIGAWGRYAHSNLIAWQQSTLAGSFLHSGVLHIAMKTGLVGLALGIGLVWAFLRHVRGLRKSNPVATALTVAACSGLLFMLPDMLLGTPIMQVRTMQLLAFCLGLPFMVSAALAFRPATRAVAGAAAGGRAAAAAWPAGAPRGNPPRPVPAHVGSAVPGMTLGSSG